MDHIQLRYPTSNTAFLLIDPFNDFLSKRGKAWPLLRVVSKDVDLLTNLQAALHLVRAKGLQVAYSPHAKYRLGTKLNRKYLHPAQYLQGVTTLFNANGFGGRFHQQFRPQDGDIIGSEHACSSGFINTDLHDQLQAQNITHLIIAGLLSNTCIESTARTAVDYGYHVTLLPECVSTWSRADHQAAVAHSYMQLGHEVLTLKELTSALKASEVADA
jgi:nicotinamidase-related amidase